MPLTAAKNFALGVGPAFDDPAWLNILDKYRLNTFNVTSPEWGASTSASGATNRTAFQAAIDAAAAAGGGDVIFSGTFDLGYASGTITPSTYNPLGYCLEIKSNVRLLGVGRAVLRTPTWSFSAGAEKGVIMNHGDATGWSVENVIFDGQSTTAGLGELGDHCIYVGYCSDWSVTHCEFFHHRGKAVASIGEGVAPRRVPNNFRINNNYMHEMGGAAVAINGGASHFEIIGNRAITAYSDIGAEVIIGQPGVNETKDGTIAFNDFYDWGTMVCNGTRMIVVGNRQIHTSRQLGGAGISCGGVDVLVQGNYVDVSAATGGNTFGINAGGVDGINVDRVRIVNNTVKRSAQKAIYASPQGSETQANIEVSGNTIYGGASVDQSAIMVASCDTFTCSGNLIRAGATLGIEIPASTTNVRVTDNTLTNSYISTGSDRAVVTGNDVISPVLCIEVGGAGTVISGNRLKSALSTFSNGAVTLRGTGRHAVVGNTIEVTQTDRRAVREDATGTDYNLIADNVCIGTSAAMIEATFGANTRVRNNIGWKTEARGSASITNGSLVAHGLAGTPTFVSVTPAVAKRIVAVTARDGTNLAISLHDDTGAAIAVAETVYWRAEF